MALTVTPTYATGYDRAFLPSNDTLQLSALFTVNGGTATKYRFYDTNALAGSGNIYVNGVQQAPRTTVEVAAGDLGSVTFVSSYGTLASSWTGRDDIQVTVFDGTMWSQPVNLAVIGDHLPVSTAGDTFHVARGGAISASALGGATHFTDPDNDAATFYRFTAPGTDASSGYFTVDGVKVAPGTTIVVRASDFTTDVNGVAKPVVYYANSKNTTESITYGVFDGRGWSNDSSITVTTDKANTAPVVTGSSQRNHAAGDHISAASLIASYFDADGHLPVAYRFYDTNANAASGSFYLNGVLQTARTTIEVSAANLSTLEFVSSTSTTGTASRDDIQVLAYDGYNWSAVSNAVIQTTHV